MKKRILFVEDDPVLLEMYLMMVESGGKQWEVFTAESGREALEKLKTTPVNVVVSDMHMRGMTGIELLMQVRDQYPRASRIILSGVKDQQEIARSLGCTHQFLAKPFNVNELLATLARVGNLDVYLNDPKLQALVGQVRSLPSFPSLYMDIMQELASENSSLESIAGIMARDPGMTAKILQIVNSAAIGLTQKINTAFEAVQFLGLGTVRSLVLSAHIFSCFEDNRLKGFSIPKLWSHSVRVASVARRILQLEQATAAEAEEAYTAGMLHDSGKLMLAASLPEQFQQALNLSAERQIPLHQAELEIYGATHAGAAGYLLGLWGLPAPVVEAVAFHHFPAQSGSSLFGPLGAVHVADVLEKELNAEKTSAPDAAYLASAGKAGRLDAWREEAGRLLNANGPE
ncbi:MAG: response regulator [Verrucomicrobiota bacterium]